jgi:hypothetical protein
MFLSVLFLAFLLFAIGSGGGVSKDEFAPVAYAFAALAVIMCAATVRAHRASTRLAGAVFGLALLYTVSYTAEWAASGSQSSSERYESRSYRIKSDDWNVVTALPLSVAAIAVGWSLSRRQRRWTATAAQTSERPAGGAL